MEGRADRRDRGHNEGIQGHNEKRTEERQNGEQLIQRMTQMSNHALNQDERTQGKNEIMSKE